MTNATSELIGTLKEVREKYVTFNKYGSRYAEQVIVVDSGLDTFRFYFTRSDIPEKFPEIGTEVRIKFDISSRQGVSLKGQEYFSVRLEAREIEKVKGNDTTNIL
jgi:hypothetical protein|nr:MAG TPA: hypothetical protein [Caudoviricetes sp.]